MIIISLILKPLKKWKQVNWIKVQFIILVQLTKAANIYLTYKNKTMKIITGLTIGQMQVNFAGNLTENEVKSEVKKYKSFYANKKDNKGIKTKVTILYS